jgi:hypothetical protein
MGVLQAPVDRQITEHMVGDAKHPANTGDHSFRSRFQFRIDTDHCTIWVVVRIFLTGAATTPAQRQAWSSAVAGKWSNTYKLCCSDDCTDGYAINCGLEFVNDAGGAHYTVTVHAAGAPVTTSMTDYNLGGGQSALDDLTHEFGHYIGNTDEYFTVNGHDYGPGRQDPSTVMNNPAMAPKWENFGLIREIAEGLLGHGAKCVARRRGEPCR